jgi:4-amino-4-deoxy-L-arabinose transferase-like glycosyltransferase
MAIAIGVIAVAVRFLAINQPFVDQWSWRQSDVAAIARNFYQTGFHVTYPQIDWAGDQPGYVGTEFPILPVIAALCYKVFGIHEWVGRVQSVILFAASLPFFFLLVRQTLGATAATWATFFYSFAPLSIMTSRCFMPDIPSLSLSIAGLYLFLHWTEEERFAFLIAAALATSLAILIKLPTGLIGVPIACLALRRYGVAAIRLWPLWMFAAIALLPSLAWYWHAHRVAEQFYPHHFFGAGGIQFESFGWYWKIAKRTTLYGLTPILLALALAGVWTTRSDAKARVFHWWLGAILFFIVVAGYGNRHPWYQLPLVPVAAALAGGACARLATRLSNRPWLPRMASAVVIVLFGALSYISARQFYHEDAADLRTLGLELKRTTETGSLIIAANYGDPTVFYYAERKGWHFLETGGIYNGHPNTSADAISDLEELRSRGATHIVFYSGTRWWLDYYTEFTQHLEKTATLLKATPQFRIYALSSPSH